MDKALDPLKASSSRKSPSPRLPMAVVTIPAFLPDAVFITSDPGMTLFSSSGIAQKEWLRLLQYIFIDNTKEAKYYLEHYLSHHYRETLEELYAS